MNQKAFPVLVVLAIIGVVLANSLYFVYEWERAVKFKFGEFIGAEIEPGLRFKWPVVNTVQKFDMRIQTMDERAERFQTVRKEELVVDSFAKWRIADLRQFYTSVRGSSRTAQNRLSQRVNSSLRAEVAKRTIPDVIAGDRAEIMSIVQQAISEEAQAIGVDVIDVRLKRVDLADEIRGELFARMESERARIGSEKRATGENEAEQIRANADRSRAITLANAERYGNETRGEGDATATRIYANAYGQDEEFYSFYRSLGAYQTTFEQGGDLMVLDPNSDFFKYFNQAKN
jgi:membrane protease subunit HflC